MSYFGGGYFDSTPDTSVGTTYQSADAADALAAARAGLAAFKAASGEEKLAARQVAAERIDASRRWQGRKYDMTAGAQPREFPRVARGSSGLYPNGSVLNVGDEIWDLDSDSNVIVPLEVRLAEIYEADAILGDPGRAERLQAIADGVTSQSNSGMSESYGQMKSDGTPKLCNEAENLLRRFKLTSGQML